MKKTWHHGRQLVRLLEEKGVTQTWLAHKLGVRRQQICKWTQMAEWRTTTVWKIARAIDEPPSSFFDWESAEKRGAVSTAADRPQTNNQGAGTFAQGETSRQ